MILFSNALNATNVLIVDPGGYRPDNALLVKGFFHLKLNYSNIFDLNHVQIHLA